MKRILILLLVFLFGIVMLSSFHEEYPDEFDSIVGGKFITEGKIPYRDWFQHHQPGAYVLAATLLPFTGQSFVRFRIALAIAFFAIHVGSYFVLRRRFGEEKTSFYLPYLFALALLSTYFWGQMLLADTLAAYFLVPGFIYLLLASVHEHKFESRDLLIVTTFTFLTWFTSMTYLYVVAALNLYAFYLYIKHSGKKFYVFATWKKLAIISLLPYIIFLAFFTLTGSLKDWYFANITYNQDYYIYNYPHAPGQPVNPIRYTAVIANEFANNYFLALGGVKGFPMTDPLQAGVALFHAAVFVYILLRKKYAFLIPLLLSLTYVCARSNPQAVKETDYQATSYLLLGLSGGAFVWFDAKRFIDSEKIKRSEMIVAGGLIVLLGIYWFATMFFAGLRFWQRFYPKYMGTAPYIYDRPDIAPYINKIVSKDDYVYIGPFEFEELFYLKTKKIPTKYHWFLQHAATSKIKDELLADIAKNRPKIIVFNRQYSPWGGDPRGFNYFFADYLDKEYVRLFKYNDELSGYYYKWKISNTMNHDIDGEFNFDRRRIDEIIKTLLDEGLIERINR